MTPCPHPILLPHIVHGSANCLLGIGYTDIACCVLEQGRRVITPVCGLTASDRSS